MIRIRWWGHSCFEISDENASIVIDPHDGTSIGIPPPRTRADIILITHDHFDHNQSRVVEKNDSTIVRGTTVHKEFSVRGVKAYHDKLMGAHRGEITAFIFSYGGITFCHLGDIGHLPGDGMVKEIGEVDVLFVPVGGIFTADAREALEICRCISTKVVIPMHYKIEGLSLPIDTVDKFLDGADCEIRYVANEIEVEPEDFSEEKEIWVFSL